MKISEMKQNAKTKLTGTYLKCAFSTLLYFIIISLLTYAQSKLTVKIENVIVLTLIQALFIILSFILGYGIIANVLDLANVKTNSITNFINETIKNATKYLKIALRIVLKMWIQIIIFFVSTFYLYGTITAKLNNVDFLCFHQNLLPLATVIFILAAIIFVFFALDYMLIAYILYSDKEKSAKEIADLSRKLMKGNKWNYILLHLSFIDWFIIASLVLMIFNIFIRTEYLTPAVLVFYALLKPYLITTKSEFYEDKLNDLNTVPEEKTEKNI
jgi:uncharacterized membrane protein